jgi:hypothetical protein
MRRKCGTSQRLPPAHFKGGVSVGSSTVSLPGKEFTTLCARGDLEAEAEPGVDARRMVFIDAEASLQ